MSNIEFLKQRLARAKAVLAEAKKKEKEKEERQLLDAFRRSGLILIDIENLAASKREGGHE